MSFVFVSYASPNKAYAYRVQRYLNQKGFDTFFAPRNIYPGQVWEEEIEKAAKECGALVVIVTREAAKSDWVKKEIRWVREREDKTVIIPLVLTNTYKDIVEKLLKDLGISDIQSEIVLKRFRVFKTPSKKVLRQLEVLRELEEKLDTASSVSRQHPPPGRAFSPENIPTESFIAPRKPKSDQYLKQARSDMMRYPVTAYALFLTMLLVIIVLLLFARWDVIRSDAVNRVDSVVMATASAATATSAIETQQANETQTAEVTIQSATMQQEVSQIAASQTAAAQEETNNTATAQSAAEEAQASTGVVNRLAPVYRNSDRTEPHGNIAENRPVQIIAYRDDMFQITFVGGGYGDMFDDGSDPTDTYWISCEYINTSNDNC